MALPAGITSAWRVASVNADGGSPDDVVWIDGGVVKPPAPLGVRLATALLDRARSTLERVPSR